MKTNRQPQHDAHIRARSRLITRIVNRRYEWGLDMRLRDMNGDQLRVAAQSALSSYRWHQGWEMVPAEAYSVFGGRQKMRVAADVPSRVIHAIMCGM